MIVKFNSANEFVDELQKEKLAKPVVRLTYLRKANVNMAPLNNLYIVATAKAADGDLIKLENYCGELWADGGPGNEKTREDSETVYSYIKEACKELQLEVRNGVWEEGDAA